MRFDENASVNGELKLFIYKAGKLQHKFREHNLVLAKGRQRLAELIAGFNLNGITKVGVGTGKNEAMESDLQLQNQVLIPIRSWNDLPPISVNGSDVTFQFHIQADEANDLLIHEFGLFTSDDVMFSRRVRSGGIFKEDDIEIKGQWIIHF